MTPDERLELIARIDDLNAKLWSPDTRELPTETLRQWVAERRRIQARYVDGLPTVPIARCPHCGVAATKRIDTFGLDGPWWDVMSQDPAPSACRHFLVLTGALNFHGLAPTGGAPLAIDRIIPGPEVPYVIPRLLQTAGMVCVLGSTAISAGRYTAYFMSYFSNPPARRELGHPSWLREAYPWVDAKGAEMWGVSNDAWDFEIGHWLDRVPPKLHWVNPDDKKATLHSAPAAECPYVNVEGRRKFLEIVKGSLRESAPPDGTPIEAGDLFDP